MTGLEEQSEAEVQPRLSDIVDWKSLFTTMAGVGIIAVVGFFVASWQITDDVKAMQRDVETLRESVATKELVERQSDSTLKDAKSYTNQRVGELVETTNLNSNKLQMISEDLKEMKTDQRRENTEMHNALRDIAKDVKQIQIDSAIR